MNFTQGIKMSFKSILSNKLRSLLTMLGIIIGVGAVIALVSIGKGTTAKVQEQVKSLGTNLLTVNIFGRGSATTVEYDQAMKFAELDGVQYLAPASNSSMTVKYGTKTADNIGVVGTNPDYMYIKEYKMASGRFLADLDIDYHEKVAVLGSTTATDLFGTENPVGQYVMLDGIHYKVVGLLQEKGSSAGASNDEVVIIPETSAERLFHSKGVRSISVQVATVEQIDQVQGELEKELSKIFRGNTNSYRVFNQQDLLDSMSSISNTLALALGGIASISLLVGGIGIMNIMLVSVTERTREIGIRKAIGAKRRDILVQFLIEAVVLSGFGGLLGVGIGLGAAQIASKAMSMQTVFSFGIVALAFGFSVVIGVVFGLFPAGRASNLKPIEALRFD